MKIADIKANAFSMPFVNPSFPRAPYRFVNREFLIISYRTDIDALRAVVPEPLKVVDPIVNFEFIRMPDSSGFGDYTESGQVIAVVDEQGRHGGYTHMMFLDDESPIAGGRELWGFPKKLASPKLEIASDTLLGTLNYGPIRIANGTMGYKYETLDTKVEQEKMAASPNYLLKIIPHIDGTLRICELNRYYLQNLTVKGAWRGPARLELFHHALAPIADLPVLEVIGAKHLICDLSLGYGEVAFDYLKA
jgi:acetoacetate decarboxylase